ncbi:MAG: Gfo/Idh/MocA family oxidoreductase [Spirochaetales bacterium]|nr:Gfo/Idh/MocA family oxidoreductase [Spirochaetales bacterium]
MSKVKYGIIGFGGIAENRLAKEGFCADASRFSPHPHAVLIGATDVNPDRRQAAEALGLQWYESAEALLAQERIEAVFVATNNRSHAAVAKAAMESGKHCLVEKPIATSLQDLRELRRLARERNLILDVDHMMVHNSYNLRARSLLEEGAIGGINDICLHMEFLYGADPGEAASWRCSVPEELGGPIGDVGSHCLYMAEFLLNSRITRLACVYLPRTLDIAVENGACIEFETESGVHGGARVAFNRPRGGLAGTLMNLGYEIYGSGGTIRGCGTLFQLSGHPEEPVPIRLELENTSGPEVIRLDEVDNIYQAVISRHARAVRSGTFSDCKEALHNLAMIVACHESAQHNGEMLRIRE